MKVKLLRIYYIFFLFFLTHFIWSEERIYKIHCDNTPPYTITSVDGSYAVGGF